MIELKVSDLMPGMIVVQAGQRATVLSSPTAHPNYPSLALVTWAFPAGHPLGLRVSFDALSWPQSVGALVPPPTASATRGAHPAVRWANLQLAMEFLNEGMGMKC